jgi:hypothetical protein
VYRGFQQNKMSGRVIRIDGHYIPGGEMLLTNSKSNLLKEWGRRGRANRAELRNLYSINPKLPRHGEHNVFLTPCDFFGQITAQLT